MSLTLQQPVVNFKHQAVETISLSQLSCAKVKSWSSGGTLVRRIFSFVPCGLSRIKIFGLVPCGLSRIRSFVLLSLIDPPI